MNKKTQAENHAQVEVLAPARLHLGFMDMHGGLGRTFGSLGLGLSDIYTHVTARCSNDMVIVGPSSHRASVYAGRIIEHLNLEAGVELTINQTIPEHAGLGSGTQLSLAIGTAIAKLYQRDISTHQIAALMDRGARSGIGVGAFTRGGFLVDGGRGENTDIPPILSRIHFPDAWRFLLIFDDRLQGVHGKREIQAFRELAPMSEHTTEYLCRLTLMQLLPALVEENCEKFGEAVTEIQCLVGDHFAEAQGGRYCSPAIAEILPGLQAGCARAVGQSSWGPTAFALYPNETQAYQALKQLRDKRTSDQSITFKICRARNNPAEINYIDQFADNNQNLKIVRD